MTRRLQLPLGHKLTLVTLAILGCSPAFAVEPNGWYAGGNVGSTRGHFDNPTNLTPFVGPGLAIGSTSVDDKDRGWKLYGGYRLTPNFALEGGYYDLGKFNYRYNTVPLGSFGGEMRVRGLNLDAVGIVPMGDRFSVFGRIGAAYSDVRTDFSRSGAVGPIALDSSQRKLGPKIGVGLQYAFTDRLSVRGEIERYRVKDPVRNRSNIDMASVGLVYYFGAPTRTVAAAPPPPPAAAAAASPAAAARRRRRRRRRSCLSRLRRHRPLPRCRHRGRASKGATNR